MSYFSLKKLGRPIAKIKGGENNGQTIHLIDKYNPKHKKILDAHKETHKRIYLNRDSLLKGLEEDIKQMVTGVKKKMSFPDNNTISLLPNMETRDCLYISGPAGAGKSYYCAKYLKQLKKCYPNKDVYLFSNKEHDKVLDGLGFVKRIPINQALVDDPIEPKELAFSCCIFDDISCHPNKKVLKAIECLRDQLLEVSRSDEVQVISTSHNLCNNNSTKMSLLESTHVICFPGAGDKYRIKRYLKEYAGLNPKQINNLLKLETRALVHHKRAPNYFMYDHGIVFPSELDY